MLSIGKLGAGQERYYTEKVAKALHHRAAGESVLTATEVGQLH
jgi:hypothetical protein